MAVTFQRAPTIAPGDPVTSAQLAALAKAFNDRLRSGLGDPTFRIHYWMYSFFRLLRNPDASGFLWPAQGEFFHAYQMLRPNQGDWPIMGPGEPEGANVSSPLAAYVLGNEAANLSSEELRLTDPSAGGLDLWEGAGVPGDAAGRWQLGKRQRGGWDPDTGALASPAFSAARSWSAIRYSTVAPYGNSYGAWLAMPELDGTACDDPDTSDDYGPPPNYLIKFDSLKVGLADVTYPGTCQPGPSIVPANKYDGHVAGISYTPWAYYVFVWDSTAALGYTVDVLSTADYLEGPYDGAPKLSKTYAGHFERALNAFVRDFRGAWGDHIPEPEPGAPPAGDPKAQWLEHAADVQRILASQYLLAPARGVELDGDAGLQVEYPSFEFTAAAPGFGIVCHADCVISMVYTDGTGIESDTSLVMTDETNTATLTVTAGPAIHLLPVPLAGTVTAYCESKTGTVKVELLEQMRYKPGLWDLALMLRCAGAGR